MTEQTETQTENNEQRRRSATRKPRRQLSSTQILFAIILTVALMLAIQFSTRIQDERELSIIRDTIEDEIELLRREQVDLIQQLSFVESDAYVEAWAHSEGRMVRNGEVLVIPVPSTITLQQANQPIEADAVAKIDTTLPTPPTWHVWWALFFDTTPPNFES